MATIRRHRGNASNGGTPAATLAPRDVAHGDDDLINRTIAVWQDQAKRPLTREDGREIIENMTGFFRLLQEWDRAERKAREAADRRTTGHAGATVELSASS